MSEVLVIADISGHGRTLERKLEGFASASKGVREGKHVILAGDLVHRGPRSLQVLKLAQALHEKTPERVTLLLGNHEANYVASNPCKFSGFLLEEETRDLLQELLEAGAFQVAVGVEGRGSTLVTHAGLSSGLWQDLGAPGELSQAVERLNELPTDASSPLWRAGVMLTGFFTLAAGPLWVSASELAESWLLQEEAGEGMPFAQVHGHSSVFDWSRQAWWLQNEELQARTLLLQEKRQALVPVAGNVLVGVDPDHGFRPVKQWEPLLLQGEIVS